MMEVLLEFGERRRILRLNSTISSKDVKRKMVEEVIKFGLEFREDEVSFQKWSQRWQCFVSVDDDALVNVEDGDRVQVIINQANVSLLSRQFQTIKDDIVVCSVKLLPYTPRVVNSSSSPVFSRYNGQRLFCWCTTYTFLTLKMGEGQSFF